MAQSLDVGCRPTLQHAALVDKLAHVSAALEDVGLLPEHVDAVLPLVEQQLMELEALSARRSKRRAVGGLVFVFKF